MDPCCNVPTLSPLLTQLFECETPPKQEHAPPLLKPTTGIRAAILVVDFVTALAAEKHERHPRAAVGQGSVWGTAVEAHPPAYVVDAAIDYILRPKVIASQGASDRHRQIIGEQLGATRVHDPQASARIVAQADDQTAAHVVAIDMELRRVVPVALNAAKAMAVRVAKGSQQLGQVLQDAGQP